MAPIDEYLNNVDPPQRAELEKIRTIIHETVPGVEEVISYGMPGFKVNKQYLIWFAAFKDHMSLFATGGPIKALKDKLEGYETSKGTIQFTVDNLLPEALIKEIVQVRLKEIENEQN